MFCLCAIRVRVEQSLTLSALDTLRVLMFAHRKVNLNNRILFHVNPSIDVND